MISYPKITIVTPNYNMGKFLEMTVESVLNQNYPNLEYIVMDGGSTDTSLDIIRRYENRLYFWSSEKDHGMYDALNKGLKMGTGEIMGWLNSDDLLHAGALENLADIFQNNQSVEWVQGLPTVFDQQGRTVYSRPPVSTREFFLSKKFLSGRYIQQESTYWRRSLWERAGASISLEYKLAGDFELWMRFFEHARLDTVSALIAGFRKRKNQLSSNTGEYQKECLEIISKYPESENIKKSSQTLFSRLRKKKPLPPTYSLRYSFDQGKFVKS